MRALRLPNYDDDDNNKDDNDNDDGEDNNNFFLEFFFQFFFSNKKIKKKIGNIFKKIIENRRIAVRVQNLATESFKFIIFCILHWPTLLSQI